MTGRREMIIMENLAHVMLLQNAQILQIDLREGKSKPLGTMDQQINVNRYKPRVEIGQRNTMLTWIQQEKLRMAGKRLIIQIVNQTANRIVMIVVSPVTLQGKFQIYHYFYTMFLSKISDVNRFDSYMIYSNQRDGSNEDDDSCISSDFTRYVSS